jgi:tetratricopeptide (TPR) repeat protein
MAAFGRNSRWTLLAAATVMLILAAAAALRRAAADARLHAAATPAEVHAACLMDPGKAACWSTLARSLEESHEEPGTAWDRAIELNPREPRTLAQAAISSELAGRLPQAEALLLQASRHNQLWLPRWTLANFYFRRGQTDKFWRWMRLAAERAYGDPRALFRLAHLAEGGDAFVIEQVLPPNPVILGKFVWYLLEEQRPESLALAVNSLLDKTTPAYRPSALEPALAAIQALLTRGEPETAVALWNRLAREGYHPHGPWTAEAPLMNGAFSAPLLGQGFDWWLVGTEGVQSLAGSPAGTAKITLSGRQPESAWLLHQFVYLPAGRRYRLTSSSMSRGLATGSGVRWRLFSLEPARPLETSCPELASDEWRPNACDTPAMDGPAVARLVLVAERQPGRMRAEGELWIRDVQLEPLP